MEARNGRGGETGRRQAEKAAETDVGNRQAEEEAKPEGRRRQNWQRHTVEVDKTGSKGEEQRELKVGGAAAQRGKK